LFYMWIMFFFSSRRRHTRWPRDWSSDVCSSDLLLGRADVVIDVLEVDLVQVAAPLREGTREEVVERLVAELAHPVRLVLVLGDRLDNLVGDAASGLEEVVLGLVRVGEAVLVLVADLLDGLGLSRQPSSPPV